METTSTSSSKQKNAEIAVFLLLAIVLTPLFFILSIGGYGLIIWLSHLLA